MVKSVLSAPFTGMQALAPKVIIRNNIFPEPHEIYNCTTCKRGRALPADTLGDKEEYNYYCRWDLKTHIGPRFGDINCPNYDRRRRIKQ